MVSPDRSVRDEGLRAGGTRATNRSPKRVVGSICAVTSAGTWSSLSGLDGEGQARAFAVGADVADLADDDAAQLHLGVGVHLVADGPARTVIVASSVNFLS